MSREIKTRENYKDIKVLDKSIHGMKRMRQASMRAKESNPQEQKQEQERHAQTPVSYAEEKVAYGTERVIKEIPHQTRNAYQTAKASAKKTEQAMRKAKQTIKNTEKATKETSKAIVNVVKATFTATKSLISMIIAGGWVAVFILLIIVLFGAWFAIAGGDESEQAELFSSEVLSYEPLIQQYADQYGMSEYVELIKAVMMQESGGLGTDPMGSSECEYNVRYPRAPNEILEPEYSIYCGILELKDCLIEAEVENPIDIENIRLALQKYNSEVEEYDSLVLQHYIFAKHLIESHI